MGISHNSAICRSTLLLAHSVYVEWHAMRNKSESEKWENSMHCLLKYHPAALWSMYSKRLLRCVLLFSRVLFYYIARMSQAIYFEIWINGDKCNNWVHPAGGYGSVGYCLLNYFTWSICSKVYDPLRFSSSIAFIDPTVIEVPRKNCT